MAYIITHNSPSVGFVSWQDLHMQYNGSAYAIANGNSDKVYIWWEAADPYVLKSSNTYPTLGAADALVLLNKNGTAFLVPGSTVLDGSLIVPGTILADALSANSVTGEKILAGAIDTGHLAAGAITADKIDADAVTAGKVAANAIGAAAIAAGAILSDHLYAGAVTAGKVAAGAIGATEIAANAITVKKLAVVPEGLQPDPAMQDESWWNRDQGWAFLTNDGSNLAYQMGVPKCLVQTGTSLTYAYCGTPEIPFAGVGQTTRMRYKAYNNSNQTMYLGVSYKRTNGSDISYSLATVAGTAGHVTGNVHTVVPAGTVKIQFWCRTNGAGFSGTMAIAEWKLDIAASADLIVDGAITANKIGAGQVTATKISVSNLSSLSANIGTVTAGIITGTTIRTTADGSGNYMEISGTTLKGKDTGGNTIWEMFPAQGPLALTDYSNAAFEKAINTSNLVNLGAYGGYADATGLPNTPEGMAQAMSDAMDWYASTGFTGRWNVTSLLTTAPRYVLVAIKATVSSGYKAEIIAGPVSPSPTWVAPPYRWEITFFQAASAVRVGIIGQIMDTRLVIVPVQKIGSSLFIHLSYSGSLTGVSGTVRIVGVFS